MEIKEGASLQGLKIIMRKVLVKAEEVWEKNDKELVVTSGTDSTHSAGSVHYYGYALDLRTRYFNKATTNKVLRSLRKDIGANYKASFHRNHIHVEWIHWREEVKFYEEITK